ncbi:hypothetical protein [Solirubrum puertoriconensis]|uniref:Uncharacterized protein n=1 Tax=Solirubrum puertoriconensis TaxID=1751427 RepID=A0A9X0HK04_SOLP1|nr:hypothetical protein [Solirubrum puertoriconensis]KUG07340.1 hypothetical protein ASU33_13360 [Solirubrum puertoriconensis]
MQNLDDKQARAYVQQWLNRHPDRVNGRRADPLALRQWQDAAVLRLREGIADDAEFILNRFATKSETHSMQ